MQKSFLFIVFAINGFTSVAQTGWNILKVQLSECDSTPIVGHPVYFKGDTLGATGFYYYDTVYTDANGIAVDSIPANFGESTWYGTYFDTPHILPDTGSTSNSFLSKGSGNETENVFYWGCTGIVELDKFTLNIFPNPFTDYIWFSNLPSYANAICLVDVMGKMVWEQKVEAEKLCLNGSLICPGSYLLLIKNKNNEIAGQTRICKQ
ncbi:MAG TPA: hypothetical protein VK177_19950 [Flavobacteriales bacterium]|nr:hypothetical protein [Flavobacteriales bacterium]